MRIKPRPLKPGDTIGVISPSSPLRDKSLSMSIQFFREAGFNIKFGEHFKDENRFLAGADETRAKDLMAFFKDPDIKAIIASRGGQGSQRLLPLLNYDILFDNPKILVGFSDTTALQLGLLKKVGLISYSGYTMTVPINPLLKRTLFACLMGEPFSIQGGELGNPGKIKGELVGGNLSLLTSLMGTPYQPDFKDCILVIEDVGVEPFNVDRMLSHLHLAGVFTQVSGVILGQFEHCISRDSSEGTIDEVIDDWISYFKVPCIKNFPYSHGLYHCVLPIGAPVILDASSLTLINPC